jgi:hypothetical protein
MLSSGFLFSVAPSVQRDGGPFVPQEEMYRTVSESETIPLAPALLREEKAGAGTKDDTVLTDATAAIITLKQGLDNLMI